LLLPRPSGKTDTLGGVQSEDEIMLKDQASILVVEDDPQILRLLQFVLGKEGYDVTVTRTGEEALEILKEMVPSLILLDNKLPGIDGFTTCKYIREFSQVPIIMVTVLGELQDKMHGIETGADFYLTKPFLPNELVARVKAILRRSTMTPPPPTNGRSGPLA
jgi:DNA-binding response OmpR family regulator